MHFLATDAGKTSLNVVNDQIASPTYAPDLAVYTKSLIEQHAPSGIYHGANSGQCSWFEFATEIFRLYNIDIDLTPVPHTEFPRPAQAPAYSALANTKGPHMRSWQDGLAAYISSQQS
jgi:dTDP-4-dehydrorhamnose reductase